MSSDPKPQTLSISLSKETYKDHLLERTGKSLVFKSQEDVLKNLRYQQILILRFSLEHVVILPSHVKVWARKRYGVELNNKKIWDSINSLVKRGILYKEQAGKRKGVYKLTPLGKQILIFIKSIPDEVILDMINNRSVKTDILMKRITLKTNREIEGFPAGSGFGVGSGFVAGGVGGVVRVHGFNSGVGFEGFVFEAWLLWRLGRFLLGWLRRVYGRSRVNRVVEGFDGGVVFDGRVVAGGHGYGSGRGRVLRSVDVFNGYPYSLEVGFDVGVVFRDGFKPPVKFLKVYFSERDFIKEYYEAEKSKARGILMYA